MQLQIVLTRNFLYSCLIAEYEEVKIRILNFVNNKQYMNNIIMNNKPLRLLFDTMYTTITTMVEAFQTSVQIAYRMSFTCTFVKLQK